MARSRNLTRSDERTRKRGSEIPHLVKQTYTYTLTHRLELGQVDRIRVTVDSLSLVCIGLIQDCELGSSQQQQQQASQADRGAGNSTRRRSPSSNCAIRSEIISNRGLFLARASFERRMQCAPSAGHKIIIIIIIIMPTKPSRALGL